MNRLVIVSALIIASLCLMASAQASGLEQDSLKVDIHGYIRREPWMSPGGTLRIPLLGEAGTLNPLIYTTSLEGAIIDCIYDTLVVMTPDLRFAGRLARDWEVSQDGRTWTFSLFSNVSWHDGKQLTAEDVAFTYNLLTKVGGMTPWAGVAALIDRAEVVDDYTVRIVLKEPFAAFLYKVAGTIRILPKHIWEGLDNVVMYKNERPVGSGPFVFVEHEPQRYYKLSANVKYHLGRPLIDELLFIVMSDPDSMLLAFSKGEIDAVTWSIPYASVDKFKDAPNVKLHKATEAGAHFMFFNCGKYPMNETLFRRAMYHLINVSEVVEAVFSGNALPGSLGFIPPNMKPWSNPDLPPKEKLYPYSVETAKKLLDELGLKDRNGDGWRETASGDKLEVTIYSFAGDPMVVRTAEMLSQGLREAGVSVKHQSVEITTLLSKLVTGDFDMVAILGGDIEPDIVYDFFHSSGGFNFGRCSFPDLDALIEKQRFTVDVDERISALWGVQRKLAEHLPVLVLAHQEFVFTYRTDNFDGWVVGPFLRPDNFFAFMNLYSVKLVKTPTPTTTKPTTPTTTSVASLTEPPKTGVDYSLVLVGVAVVALVVVIALYMLRRK
ncbi:MAG: ABC transporter substrate-binding protein [Zestosphaera sp.]